MRIHELVGKNLAKPSGWFGKVVGLFMNIRNRSLNRWTIDLLRIKSNDFVLEIGYGTGATIKLISQQAFSGLTSGIDYSKTMFYKASKVNAKAVSEGKVILTSGDALSLPYQDEYFDKICSIHCIYFWADPEKTLKEIWRVLKQHGTIAISVDAKEELSKVKRTANFRLYTTEELTDLLTNAGFHNVQIETHPNRIGLCALGVK